MLNKVAYFSGFCPSSRWAENSQEQRDPDKEFSLSPFLRFNHKLKFWECFDSMTPIIASEINSIRINTINNVDNVNNQ